MYKVIAVLCGLLAVTLSIAKISIATISSDSEVDDYQATSEHMTIGVLEDKRLPESSGLAISQLNHGTLWSHNDSGNEASLVAFTSQGEFRAVLAIQNVENNDWEDIAAFQYKGVNYLLIADTGDNYAWRNEYWIHIIREPVLDKPQYKNPISVTPEWSISYTYPDKARDSEAIAVDTLNEKIVLLSKRDESPTLFELELTKRQPQIAKKLGSISAFPKPIDPKFRLIDLLGYSNQPTAMDIAPDGLSIAVLTYDSAFVFTAPQNPTTEKIRINWHAVLSTTPTRFVLPSLKQAESMAFDTTGESLIVLSENLPSPIIKIELK